RGAGPRSTRSVPKRLESLRELLRDRVESYTVLLAAGEVLHLDFTAVELRVANDQRIGCASVVRPAEPLFHVPAIGHVRGDTSAAQVRKQPLAGRLCAFAERNNHGSWLLG